MDAVLINKLTGGYENHTVLKDISVTFFNEQLTAIIGPNGSGKSTLIKYLIKELRSSGKTISILDKDIEKYSQKELAKNVSLVPQMAKQEYEFTVKELVSLGRYCHNDIETNTEAIDKSINLVGIGNIQNKLITEISGGELQLAMLARAICQETDIILLDEPTNNLDPKHQLILMDILSKLKQQNKTIICVIHDLNAVLHYFDNVVLMKDGRIYDKGKVKDVVSAENISKVYGINATITQARGQLPATIYYNL